ncbi:unnamed protein product [Schistosoma mattheei]|uniref:Enhancer of mRNA-decapping protein 4 WD40 repeat region domain-containing protein n=1 Tax=Schistosoma mattheei TaxID=31246 RepID=A0AA85AR17_9TREM|nr:unnamed protein product [Schistosoma mattheei]
MTVIEEIKFSGNDEENIREICSSHVRVYPSAKSALDCRDVSASCKISIQPAVKYFWEYQYYVTRLIARHHASSLIAYAIKHVKKTDSDEDIHVGMVRLLNTETGKKLLLRSFTDRITYIDFALRSEALLGILDHSGAVSVFKIDQGLGSEDPMTSSLFFSLNPPENFVPLDISSLVWCPWLHGSKTALPLANDIHDDVFVPPHDPSLLLAYSAHHKVKVINVGLVVELLQNHFSQDVQSEVSTSWSEKQLIDAIEGCTADSLYYAELSDHSDAITALSLSRDATCLGSASLDGKVCIYSLVSRMAGNMKYKLRPIHVFSPHGGLPLYALIFLDNVLHNDESITWSYLLTGAESNREIRLWSCYDWSCLQVIQFCSVIPSTDLLKSLNISLSKSSIILAVDQSASFLIATDVTRRVLYTLELAVVKDVLVSSDNERSLSSSSSSMLSVSKKICCFISIGEFLLTTPCLLFALGPSSRKAKTGVDPLSIKEKIGSHKVLMDQICLDIHIIHNRNLLNGTIRFDLPHRSESDKLELITNIMRHSSVESPVHHQQELADSTLPTAIDSSSNKDMSSSIPSPFTSSLNINAIVQEKVESHEQYKFAEISHSKLSSSTIHKTYQKCIFKLLYTFITTNHIFNNLPSLALSSKSRIGQHPSFYCLSNMLVMKTLKHVYISSVLDERDSSEILTSKQLGHDSLMPNTLENQLLMEKLTNLNSSNSHLSIKTEIEGNSSFNHNMETISPSQHEPPEAEKLQNVLSVTLLNMTNQSTEELVFESISKTADKTAISDFPPMNCVPSLCSTGDNCTLPTENTTTTHQQHYRSGVAVGDNGNDDDDDNGEIDFEDNAPDSVDKLLSDTTTNKIPLNSSSPTRDNNGNNENLSNEAYTTTNHIDENDLIFLTTTTTTSSMSPPLELLPPSLPSQLSLTMLPTKDTTLWSTTATNTTAKETHLQNSSPLDITSASLSTCNFVVYDDDGGGGGGGGEGEGVGRAVDNADEEGDDDDDCRNYQSFEDLKSILKEEDILNATINRIDTVNETTEHDSHNNKNNKVNTNDDDNRRTHNEMNRILNHLEMLSINSEKQSKQFDYILDQLNETKLKLERLEQTQFDIIEQINNVNYQGSLIPSTQPSNIVTMTESNVNLEHWEIKSMELSNQIISQLRTVQGDSARRYAKISENMNKILSNIQDPNHSMKTNMLHNLESRVNALPTITSDCIRRVLHEELLRVFSNNLSRIVEPLQQSLFNVLKDHLSSLPTTLTDNVQRTLREKNFTTQIVRSASGILSTELSNAYRDSLNKIYVPALEKSTKKLFTDLNNVFQLGTQQYLNQISSRIQTPSFDATNFTPLMNQISSMIKSTLTETLKEVESKRGNSSSLKLNQSSDSYTTNTIDRNDHYSDVVFDNVKHKQSNSTMLDKTAVNKKSYNRHLNKSGIVNTPLVSGSNNNNNSNNNNPSVKNKIQTTNESPYSSNLLPQPPLSTLTPTTSSSSLSSSMKQDKLTRLFRQAQVLIHSDRLVDALELALVSTDQPLLLDICNDIDVNKLFSSGDHTIGQNILLSLIHQLSCGDLSAQLDLKVKYLQEAILCLEFDDPTTSVHGPAILHLLNTRLDTLLNSTNNNNNNNSINKNNNKITNALRNRVIKLNRTVKCLFKEIALSDDK